MDIQKRCLQAGAVVLAFALLWKLAVRFWGPLSQLWEEGSFASALLFLETGRLPDPSATASPDNAPPAASTAPTETLPPMLQAQPVFAPGDGALVSVSPLAGCGVDTEAMLAVPLQWQLKAEQPTVLILHSHATESYTPTETEAYTPSSPYRTLDPAHNMLRVGTYLQELLEAEGIRVLHDKTLHDYPDFNSAYSASRATVERYLSRYPSICLVLDLHRDAADTGNAQLRTSATVNGKQSAQLMFVIGTDGTGLYHPNWQENMALAVKLQATLEKANPGICRPVNFRAQRFNQDLSSGSMIVEVGAAGDSLEEALVGVEALAQAIITLSSGLQTTNSAS